MLNNLASDSHDGMQHFKKFWADLKQLESLLRMNERRLRFIWTCLRHSPWSSWEKSFERFSGSLYEERWHEITVFLKKLNYILKPLCLAWNEERFRRNVDQDGMTRPEQHKKELKEQAHSGMVSFNSSEITRILKSPFFHLYCHMVVGLDSIPDQLAQELELCECHKELNVFLSQHKRQALMSKHFGHGVITCPFSGWSMPEVVTGKVDDLFESILVNTEQQLLETELISNVDRPSEADWSEMLSDFRIGKESQLAILTIKMGPIRTLPRKFYGLAALDEEKARRCGEQIKEQWSLDPRPEVHDRHTVKLMTNKVFVENLDAFVGGKPRRTLARSYKLKLGIFRVAFTVETSIEAKHAAVTTEKKRHHIGPVKISLSNRLPLLESQIRSGHVEVRTVNWHFPRPAISVKRCHCSALPGILLSLRRFCRSPL